MEEQVTLKDIAKALGISLGTVERAIHGKSDINPETKKRVLEKIHELNYHPNKHARSLSLKNKKKIAVIMPYTSRFWYGVKAGLDNAAQEMSYYGMHVKFIGLDRMNRHLLASHINTIKEENYDGLILVPTGLEDEGEFLKQVISKDICLVLLNDDMPQLSRHFYIGPNNELVGKLAGELVGKFTQGQGKCLILSCNNAKTGQMLVECQRRIAGFQQVIREEYPQLQTHIETYAMYMEDAYSTLLHALQQNQDITCIYGAEGLLDEAAMALKDSGKKGIPLVGHEMSEEVDRHLKDGSVSAAICQNPFSQGYNALKYMVEYLVEGKKPLNDNLYIDFNIYTKYNTYNKEKNERQ